MLRGLLIACFGLFLATVLAACGGDNRQPKVDQAKIGGMDTSDIKSNTAKPVTE